jgi:hypothetical protein
MEDKDSAAQPPFDTVPVDQNRRIELKLSFVEATLGVKLSPRQTIRFWGFVGTEGQIQLLPPDSELARLRDKFENAAGEEIRWQDATDERFEIYRRMAGFLRVRCHRRQRSNNLQISFPADAVHLEVIEIRKRLVVVAKGEVLEFWRIDRWKNATSIADLSAFTDQVRRMLDDGEPSS